MQDVLLLNQDGNPLTLWPLSTLTWQQAIKALYLDKVTVLRSYDDWICHSQHLALPVPSVVMMSRYHQQQGTVNFTRRNIFLRDRFHCQYCLHQFSADHLTIDHVIPKSRGGGMRWKNVVAACHKCNLSKGANIVQPSLPRLNQIIGKWSKSPKLSISKFLIPVGRNICSGQIIW